MRKAFSHLAVENLVAETLAGDEASIFRARERRKRGVEVSRCSQSWSKTAVVVWRQFRAVRLRERTRQRSGCFRPARAASLKTMVDERGFEPPASSLRTRRSPS